MDTDLTDVTDPGELAELRRGGYSDGDLRAVAGQNAMAGQNALRVLRAAEDVTRDQQARRGPSTTRIEDLDG